MKKIENYKIITFLIFGGGFVILFLYVKFCNFLTIDASEVAVAKVKKELYTLILNGFVIPIGILLGSLFTPLVNKRTGLINTLFKFCIGLSLIYVGIYVFSVLYYSSISFTKLQAELKSLQENFFQIILFGIIALLFSLQFTEKETEIAQSNFAKDKKD